MKTRVPETITCVNCGHNVVIKLYEVDTTINSAQGHFHTLHNPAEPPYTVYCMNCGHFMTNDPDHVAAKSAAGSKTPGSTPPKRPALASGRVQKKAVKAAAAGKADRRKAQVTTSAAKPDQKLGQASKTQTVTVSTKSSPMKPPRVQRKKAK
jgi:Zn ribbon nucleic-acid-binding protein